MMNPRLRLRLAVNGVVLQAGSICILWFFRRNRRIIRGRTVMTGLWRLWRGCRLAGKCLREFDCKVKSYGKKSRVKQKKETKETDQ